MATKEERLKKLEVEMTMKNHFVETGMGLGIFAFFYWLSNTYSTDKVLISMVSLIALIIVWDYRTQLTINKLNERICDLEDQLAQKHS